MKTSYLTHILAGTLVLTTLMSCGGSKQTTGAPATSSPEQAKQTERDALDQAIENSRLAKELLGAKSSERNSFEIEFLEEDGVKSLYIVGESLEINQEIAEVIMQKLNSQDDSLFVRIDHLTISAPLFLPSVKVELVGETLSFINEGLLNVSGNMGMDAGEIIYEFEKIEDLDQIKKKRFFLNGGVGTPAEGGAPGSNGRSIPSLGGDVVWRRTVRISCPSSPVRDFSRFKARECFETAQEEGVKACPESGSAGQAPTLPGRGGRRGSFQSSKGINAQVASMIEGRDGENAATTSAIPGGSAGTPRQAIFEYVLIQNNGSRSVKQERCGTTSEGMSITPLSASTSEREALPWGVRVGELNPLSTLKKASASLRFISEFIGGYDMKNAASLVAENIKLLSEFKASNEEEAYQSENLLQQLRLSHSLIHFINKYGFLGSPLKGSRAVEVAKVFLTLGEANTSEHIKNFFDHFGLRQGIEFSDFSSSSIDEAIKFEIHDFLNMLPTDERELSNFESLSLVERQATFANFWNQNSIDKDAFDKLLQLAQEVEGAKNRVAIFNLMLATKVKLERNQTFLLMAYGYSETILSLRKSLVRWQLMLSAQRIGRFALAASTEVSAGFMNEFDLKLIDIERAGVANYDNYQLQSAASQLMAPIYRYAQ